MTKNTWFGPTTIHDPLPLECYNEDWICKARCSCGAVFVARNILRTPAENEAKELLKKHVNMSKKT